MSSVINTKFFDTNSKKSFTEACNKVSTRLKSKLVAKFRKLKKSRKINDLTKSKDDTSNTKTTTTTTTTPSVSRIINSYNKNIANVQKSRLVLPPLKYPLEPVFDKSTPLFDEVSFSSFEDINRYDSDEDSIFESPIPTAASIYEKTANSGTAQGLASTKTIYSSQLVFPSKQTQLVCFDPIVSQPDSIEQEAERIKRLAEEEWRRFEEAKFTYDTDYISQFIKRVEKELVSVKETANYVSEFFNLVENHKESEEKAPVSMEYIWMRLYYILTTNSDNLQLQLFELSEMEITTNLAKSISDTKQRKKQIPKYDKPHPNRVRNQKLSTISAWHPHHKLF